MFRTYDISNFIYTFFGIFVKLKELYKKHSYTDLKYLFSCPVLKCKNK